MIWGESQAFLLGFLYALKSRTGLNTNQHGVASSQMMMLALFFNERFHVVLILAWLLL